MTANHFTPDQQEILWALGIRSEDHKQGGPRRHRMVHEDVLGHLKANALRSLVIAKFIRHRGEFYVLSRTGWQAYKSLRRRATHLDDLRFGDVITAPSGARWEVQDIGPSGVVYVATNDARVLALMEGNHDSPR